MVVAVFFLKVAKYTTSFNIGDLQNLDNFLNTHIFITEPHIFLLLWCNNQIVLIHLI